MEIDLKNLPVDVDILHSLVRDMLLQIKSHDGEVEHFKAIIKKLQRAQFGQKSERLDTDQLLLALEELTANEEQETAPSKVLDKVNKPRKRTSNRAVLPGHLPRDKVIIDIPDKACPSCTEPLQEMGETTSELLHWIPGRLRVKPITRPKYICRTCAKIQQQPAQDRIAGIATPALLTQVLISKYCDHLPLYRQAQIFADDTTIPVLDPGRGQTKTGRFWVYTRDQKPWKGKEPPVAIFYYEPDRKAKRPETHLKDFKGILHVDGYAGFEGLTSKGDIKLAACWAHTRRYFFEIAKATHCPISMEALQQISQIYAVDAEVRGMSRTKRLTARRKHTRPLVTKLHEWLEKILFNQFDQRSPLVAALKYALSRWRALTRFITDGRIELDTNSVERAIRPVTLGRKNSLFAGSDEGGKRWAIISSFIETAKMNNVEPYTYLQDIFQRMENGHPINRIEELLPWNWKNLEPVNP